MPTRRSLYERSDEQSGQTSPMTVPASPQDEAVEPSQTIINMKNVQIIIKKESTDEPKQPAQTAPVDGGILTPEDPPNHQNGLDNQNIITSAEIERQSCMERVGHNVNNHGVDKE